MYPFLPPIATALSLLVGHPTSVVCQANGYEGTVGSPVAVQISPLMCADYRAPLDNALDRQATSAGLLVLLHEAEHIRHPAYDETQTECQSLRDYLPTLALLRVPKRLWPSMYQAALSADQFFFGDRESGCNLI